MIFKKKKVIPPYSHKQTTRITVEFTTHMGWREVKQVINAIGEVKKISWKRIK